MTKPEPAAASPAFELAAVDREMRQEEAYQREGHTARTLVRELDLRIVLVVMKEDGRIAEHRAGGTISVHALTGHVQLHLPDKVVDLPAGRLVVLEHGMRHDVRALAESAFLLTLAWDQGGR
jgi:quercetin dioxygenase-like cupin family protein